MFLCQASPPSCAWCVAGGAAAVPAGEGTVILLLLQHNNSSWASQLCSAPVGTGWDPPQPLKPGMFAWVPQGARLEFKGSLASTEAAR